MKFSETCSAADEGEPELPDLRQGAVRRGEDRRGEVVVAQKLLQMQDLHQGFDVSYETTTPSSRCHYSLHRYFGLKNLATSILGNLLKVVSVFRLVQR